MDNKLLWDFTSLRCFLFDSMLEKTVNILNKNKVGIRTLFPRERQEYLRGNLSFRENSQIIVALSLTYIDDVIVPYRKDLKEVHNLLELVGTWSSTVVENILKETNDLRVNSIKTLDSIEAFVHMTDSRREWESLKVFPNSLPYTNDYGLNEAQKIWIHFNSYEDYNMKKTLLWDTSVCIASAASQSPQYASGLQNQVQKHKEERNEYVRKLLYEKKKDESGNRSRTLEDLAEIAINDLEGRLDDHDIAVKEYEREILERHKRNQELVSRQDPEVVSESKSPWDENEMESSLFNDFSWKKVI